MHSRFRLGLDVVLDSDMEGRVIEAARRSYAIEGAATTADKKGRERTISAEEFIAGIEDALMELLERNPLLRNENIDVERVSCTPSRPIPKLGRPMSRIQRQAIEEIEYDAEGFETGPYPCR